MSAYLWIMVTGSAIIFALYGLYCTKADHLPILKKRSWETALLAFIFAAICGSFLARVGYALLMSEEFDFEYEGIGALAQLLEFDYEYVSFFCGAAGACLGVALANRMMRKGAVLTGMDAFAPFGALIVALFRSGELCFGSYGLGRTLSDGNPLNFFPFAMKITDAGGHDIWRWAVCVLSAVFALILAGIIFFRLRNKNRIGFCFTLTLFYLSLTQILCESLRTRGLRWLFVHVEQLLCAIVLLIVLLVWILQSRKAMPFIKRCGPLIILFLGIGLLVATEFALDGKFFNIPLGLSYLFMCAVLTAIGWAGSIAARRYNAEC